MDVKEFRVGNYVLDEDGKVYQLKPIDIYNISVNPDAFKPICIDGELLLKLGFGLEYGENYSIKPSDYEEGDYFFCIQKHSDGWWFYVHEPIKNVDIVLSVIDNVHELQNILLDLTGKELVFKH